MPKNRLDSFGNQSVTGSYDEVTMTTGSLSLDTTSQYLSIASSAGGTLDLTNKTVFTIEGWIYLSSYNSSESAIISNRDSGSTGGFGFRVNTSNQLQFYYTGGSSLSTTSTLSLNTWYHVAMVRNSANAYLFINGVLSATSASFANGTTVSQKISIGRSQDDTTTTLNGYMTNIRVLSGTALYTVSFTPSTVPLENITNTVLLLKCANSSTYTTDSSSSPQSVTNNGNVGFNYQSLFNDTPCGSIFFNTSSKYLSTPAVSSLTTWTGDFTVEAWIYPSDTGLSNWGVWDSRQSGGSNDSIVLRISPLASPVSGQGRMTYWNGTYYYGTTTVYWNTWTHVAWVRSGTTLTFYVNGVAGGTATISGTQTGTATTNPVVVGTKDSPYGSYGTTGYMTNFRLVNGTAVYTGNFTPPSLVLPSITNTSLLLNAANSSTFTTDSSPNAYTITNSGTSVYRQFAPITSVRQRVQSDGTMLLNTAIDEVTLTTGSLYFDGTSQYLTVPANTAFAYGTGDFTVEGWIYPTTLSSNPLIWNQSISGTNYFLIGIDSTTSKMSFTFATSGAGTAVLSSTNVTINQWNHFAVVRVAGVVTVYLNGIGGTATACTQNFTDTTYVPTIGRLTYSGSQFFGGSISSLRVVKGTGVYTANFIPPSLPLENITNTSLLLKTFSFSTATTDSSSNAFTVTNFNTVAYHPQNPFNYLNSTFGSINFNGTSQYLTVPANTAFAYGTGDFTVEGWINPTALSGTPIIWSQTVSGTNYFLISVTSASSILNFTFATSGAGTVISSTATLALNQWSHFAVVRSSGVVTVYVNGVGGTATACAQNFTDTTYVPTIGRSTYNAAQYFSGAISNFRVVKGTAVYTSNFTPPASLPLTNITNTSLLLQVANSSAFITDSSTNAFTVTNNGTATYTLQGGFDNISSGSLFFNTSTIRYLTIANNAALYAGTGNFTTEAWVRLAVGVDGNQKRFFSQQATGTSTIYWVGVNASTKFAAQIRGSTGTGDISLSGITTPVVNTWYHVAFTRSGSNTYLFVNGILEANATGQTQNVSTSNTSIGAYAPSGEFWNGYITNLRHLVGTALYTANFTPPATILQPIGNTALLLQAANQPAYMTDSSTNKFAVSNIWANPYRQHSPIITTKQKLDVTGTHYVANTYDEVSLNNGSVYLPNSSYCYTATMPSLNSNNFTIECWVNQSSTTTEAPLVKYFATDIIEVRLVNGALTSYYNNGAATIGAGSTLANNLWYHVALVRNGTTLTQYLNGVANGSATISGTSNATSVYIGRNQSTGGGNAFNGSMAKLRISNTAVYTTNFTPTTDPLIANSSTHLLMFNEANTTNYNLNFGTASGVTVANVGLVPFHVQSPNNDQPCGSILFNGTTQYLSVGTSGSAFAFGTGDFTTEYWAYPTSFSNNPTGLDLRSGGAAGYSDYFTTTTGYFNLYWTTGLQYTSASPISLNAWTHIAVVRQSSLITVYINGTQSGSSFASTTNFVDTNAGRIGYNGVSSYFAGYITNVRVIKGTALYTANFTPPTTVLQPITNTALLLKVANSSTIVTDSSTNAFTVTNNNTALYKQFAPLAN